MAKHVTAMVTLGTGFILSSLRMNCDTIEMECDFAEAEHLLSLFAKVPARSSMTDLVDTVCEGISQRTLSPISDVIVEKVTLDRAIVEVEGHCTGRSFSWCVRYVVEEK